MNTKKVLFLVSDEPFSDELLMALQKQNCEKLLAFEVKDATIPVILNIKNDTPGLNQMNLSFDISDYILGMLSSMLYRKTKKK